MKKFKIILFLVVILIGIITIKGYQHKEVKGYPSELSYCSKNGLDTTYCIYADFSIPSGKDRFFIYNTVSEKVENSSICLHGNGKGNTAETPVFSNKIGSNCTSLGHYEITGVGVSKNYGIPILKLKGLDSSNSNAEKRGIYIHPALTPTLATYLPSPQYMPLTMESEGCFAINYSCFNKLKKIVENSNKPILLYAYQ